MITNHANERASHRLAKFIDSEVEKNVIAAMRKYTVTNQKYYVIVKKFNTVYHINEDSDNSGRGINGDCLVAVIRNGGVKTIMLAKSWNKSYFERDGIYVQ